QEHGERVGVLPHRAAGFSAVVHRLFHAVHGPVEQHFFQRVERPVQCLVPLSGEVGAFLPLPIGLLGGDACRPRGGAHLPQFAQRLQKGGARPHCPGPGGLALRRRLGGGCRLGFLFWCGFGFRLFGRRFFEWRFFSCRFFGRRFSGGGLFVFCCLRCSLFRRHALPFRLLRRAHEKGRLVCPDRRPDFRFQVLLCFRSCYVSGLAGGCALDRRVRPVRNCRGPRTPFSTV